MRRYLLYILCCIWALPSLIAQSSVILNDSTMFIGQTVDSLTEEERYFNPVYLVVQEGKEHIKQQLICGSICDCDTTIPNRRIGIFSVAPNKYVSFSQGNLQYFPAANLWKFADNQYDYLGNANKYLSPDFRNWIDLFGWSGDKNKVLFGISTSTNAADYAGEFLDWGTNHICGDTPNTWRTLSIEEWEYLFKKRTNATRLYSKGSINGIRGMILLPDYWVQPEGVSFVVAPNNLTIDLDINTYTLEEWQKMEEAGAVFLSITGRRDGKVVGYIPEFGTYWGSTQTNGQARHLYFNYDTQLLNPAYIGSKNLYARAVRLVHDTIAPKVTLTIKYTPDTATASFYCDGQQAYGNSITVEYGKSPLYQVEATDAGYLSQGDTIHHLTKDTTLYIHLKPFSQGNWVRIDNRFFTKWESYFVSGRTGIFAGPYTYWNHYVLPVTEGDTYRARAVAGQNAPLWFASSTAPDLSLDIKPTKVACSANGGICRYIAEEFTIPKGTKYLIINARGDIDKEIILEKKITSFTPAKGIGVFSVAKDKQVSFSQGNLQYIQSTNTWIFTKQQYEYLGDKNLINKYTLADTIDLFGWSGTDSKAAFGVSASTNNDEYTGDFLDWGINSISGNAPNTWRTLSWDEWNYLLNKRPNASQLFGVASIDGANGLIILPDNWQCPKEIAFVTGYAEKYAGHQSLSIEQWKRMEASGAVFLHASGGRYEHGKHATNSAGGYWCSLSDASKANYLWFSASKIVQSNTPKQRYYGRSVRLVRDTIIPKIDSTYTAQPEYVDLGLSVKWATFNVGASKPEEYGDYFAWGETEPKEEYSWATYKWGDGTESNMTKYNKVDKLTTLEPQDDAAYMNWSSNWRMPTKAEIQELFDQCTWVADTINGISGHKAIGPNGNSIFLPAAGFYNNDHGEGVTVLGRSTYYWSNTSCGYNSAYDLIIDESGAIDRIGGNTRRIGFPIRPVYDDACYADMCGSVEMSVTCTHPSAYQDGFIGGGIYTYKITTNYTGEVSLYAGDANQIGSTQICVQSSKVVAGIPTEGTIYMPISGSIRLAGSDKLCDFTKVFFRTHQDTIATIDYEFTLIGKDTNPLEGTAVSYHDGISYRSQRIFGFNAGDTYTYELSPKYTGNLTLYASYSDSSERTGSEEAIELITLPVTSNQRSTGTITIPTIESTIHAGMQPDCLIIRTYQQEPTEVEYLFSKQ